MRPDNWLKTVLGDIVVPEHGLQTGPFGSQLHASDYVPEGVPVIMPRDLSGNAISNCNAARIPIKKADELGKYRLRAGDIIFARRGSVGRCALVEPRAEGWLCGTGCLRARLSPSVLPEFLIQLLQWQTTVSWLIDNAVGQTMKNLNTKILSNLPLDIPPLSNQRRIAEVLQSVDDSILATQKVMQQTLRIKHGFLQHLLTLGTQPTPGPKTGTTSTLSAGWSLKPIGELCTFVNGYGFKASEWAATGLPIIRIKNLNGSRDFKFFPGVPNENWIVEAGELLFAWAGVKGVSFGPRIWDGPQGVLNQHIYKVRPADGVAKAWLFETLRHVTRSIEERAQGFKASLVHIRKADITDYPVPVPPYAEQRAIAERSAFISEMESIEQSNLDGLVKMKGALMGDLFTGRVSADQAAAIQGNAS